MHNKHSHGKDTKDDSFTTEHGVKRHLYPHENLPYGDVDLGVEPMKIVPTGTNGNCEDCARGYGIVAQPQVSRELGASQDKPMRPWKPKGRKG